MFRLFQSPSDRGVGPDGRRDFCRTMPDSRFNPLLIGVWVRTGYMVTMLLGTVGSSFNPLLIGVWVRTNAPLQGLGPSLDGVSIPF